MKIILLGYMGSGKSLIGIALSNILSCDFIDLDDYIEVQEKKNISEIFSKKGELHFRNIEKKHLETLLLNPKKQIIALGGGTPCYFDTMNSLLNNRNVRTVYLNVSVANLTKRLFKERTHRPLISHLNKEQELSEFIGKHFFERLPYYNKAHIKVDANKTPNEIVNEIVLKLF